MARLLLLVVAFALVASGCGIGHKEDETKVGETEGIWIDAGPLDYQVQGSRQLIATQVPDDRYLSGLPDGYPEPGPDETWFAIFLRIENKTDAPAPSAEEFEIEDTEGNIYRPVALDHDINAFAYEPRELGIGETIPHPDSTQEFNVVGGALVFKLPLTSIANRPLEFKVVAPDGDSAMVTLDV